MNYNRINKNYKTGLWTIQMVRKAYELGYITATEYYTITGRFIEDGEIHQE